MLTDNYADMHAQIVELLESSRRAAARTFNVLMTKAYWEIGRRIVNFEQEGAERAGYGEELLQRLAFDLTKRFGRGYSMQNLLQMRKLYYSGRKFSRHRLENFHSLGLHMYACCR